MTNLKRLLSLCFLVAACSESPTPPAPAKVYDFGATPLVDVSAPPRPSGPLGKTTIRAAIQTVQSRLVSCAKAQPHPAGTIEVTLRVAADEDSDAIVEWADVRAFGHPRIESCMRDVLMTIELPPMVEPAIWSIHYPFIVDTNG